MHSCNKNRYEKRWSNKITQKVSDFDKLAMKVAAATELKERATKRLRKLAVVLPQRSFDNNRPRAVQKEEKAGNNCLNCKWIRMKMAREKDGIEKRRSTFRVQRRHFVVDLKDVLKTKQDWWRHRAVGSRWWNHRVRHQRQATRISSLPRAWKNGGLQRSKSLHRS